MRTRSERTPVKTLLWWVLILLVAAVLADILYAAFSSTASGHVSTRHSHGGAAVGAIAVACLWVVVAWIERVRLRRRHRRDPRTARPARVHASQHADAGGERVVIPPARGTGIFTAACMLALLGFLAYSAVTGDAHWRQSQVTQDHGIRTTGTVIAIKSESHPKRYGSYTTIDLVVRLTPPVEGQVVTTVHTQYSHPPFPVGRSVVILVERTDPGYGELPGHPLANRGDVVLALAIAVLPVLLLLLVAHGEVQRLRARRRQPAPEGHLSSA